MSTAHLPARTPAPALLRPLWRLALTVGALAALSGCASMQKEAMAPSMESSGDWEVLAADDAGGDRRGTVIHFDDDAITGALATPEGAYLAQRKKVDPAASPSDAPSGGEQGGDEKGAFEASKRLVIYTGSLGLMVPSTEKASKAFITHIEGLGGYLQSRNSDVVTVRVPADRFFAVVEHLRTQGEVQDENINANDVTKKVFDLELRLQTASEARARLLKLLESATVMADVLAIEAQVRRLTDEIELMKGELRNLGDQIAFSTLTVRFFANAPAPTPYPRRTRSRFPWINQVGIERVLNAF